MKKYADIFVLLSGLLWGLVGPPVDSLGRIGFSSIQISALRWVFSAFIMFILVLIFNRNLLKIRLKDIWIFPLTGIMCILLSSTLYFVTMPLTTVAVANILMYTSPVWILIFSIIFFNEKITAKKLTCIALAFWGCAFATGIISTGNLRFTPLGILTGLGSGLFYGLYSVFGKIALKKYDSVTVTLYTVIFAGIGSLFIINFPETANLIQNNPKSLMPLAALVILMTIAPYTLYTLGLKFSRATRVAVIACVEPMTSAIVGTFLMNEPFTLFQFLGIVMILTACILLQFKKQ